MGATRIRLGKGKVGIGGGSEGDTPILYLVPTEGQHSIGEKIREVGTEIPFEEIDRDGAVIIELPEYGGVDVLLHEVVCLWAEAKQKEWDGE